MAAQGRQIGRGRFERQGPCFLQQSQSGQAGVESTPARGRLTARLFLRSDEWHEKEVDQCKDGQRSGLTYQQEPAGVELLT